MIWGLEQHDICWGRIQKQLWQEVEGYRDEMGVKTLGDSLSECFFNQTSSHNGALHSLLRLKENALTSKPSTGESAEAIPRS